jgi:tRNA pseudouridine55 synthase
VSSKLGATELVGILPLDKPAGMTSHDVVSAVRQATGERRVGHAGTLDPLATGLLVVLVGPATRLAPWLSAAQKSYVARFVFGTRTDTDDAEGKVVATADVPATLAERDFAAASVRALEREHLQVPPVYSAVKVDGQTAHRAARAGRALELEPRTIRVLSATLLEVDAGPPVTWDVDLTVSKGTYVRALARDLGQELGTEAHLGALRRTASGTLTLADAHALEEVQAAGLHGTDASQAAGAVDALFIDPVRALGLAEIRLDDAAADRVSHGIALASEDVDVPLPPAGEFVSLTYGGSLLGVYESRGDRLYAAVVLPKGHS